MNSPGYLSNRYGNSFREFGEIVSLPSSGIQLIKRRVFDDLFDLTGVIPFIMCHDWERLTDDMDFLRDTGAVSATFVADPFETETIQNVVSDWTVCRHFKTQVVVDLRRNWRSERSRKMRKYTLRSLAMQSVESVVSKGAFAEAFWELYGNTIDRHHVSGMQRLSLDILTDQLEIEGAVLLIAKDEHGMTGAMLSFDHGQTANAHLLFLSKRAHEIGTNYALIYSTLVDLEDRGCRFVNLGGAAGSRDDPTDGLFQFKRRWSNERRNSTLCGQVLNQQAYENLQEVAGVADTTHFPAYRGPTMRVGRRSVAA